ncbi:hypothetical protein MMG03_002748 [Fibrobacter succinogenes]|uniref:hypothetical protein n=2 Tax=Fibrobacter TaxID=832 RepID=UPI00090F6D48|nr:MULTISPECIES: hypothetical protein [unclassified Fibrobacter]MCL4103133.1 hypothetical protein [Fibrobacter succinogenes]MCQ2100922.1 hypothetical protein [Fibrobacter sp.]OWV07144.1 hypothetical protein B7992_14490 [Fibrobacter sp. UWH1]SHK46433.1 hypothetical protein SAMN05720764_101489 [Fibrobacter sp. UWH5]
MHVLKNKIVLAAVAGILMFFAGCAGSSSSLSESAAVKDAKAQNREIDKQAALEAMFQKFLAAIRVDTPADTLLEMLTDPSENWLDELERHAMSYTEAELDTCQFYEIYSILLYRLYEREHLWEVSEDRMLWLYLSKAGMFQRFTSLKLGPMKVKNDRGSIGLANSPEVPIMLFEWDDNDWKLDLVETVPLITKGVEATAVKKNWTDKKLALYWLDREYHLQYSRLDESLFNPIGF